MKAVRRQRYGPPEALRLEEVDPPTAGEGELLVRVRAASVNPLDFHFLRGTPYLVRAIAGLSRPKAPGLGADFAGIVDAVGPSVTTFQPGDEVYGSRVNVAFAEYLTVRADRAVVPKPANLTFEQASAVPVAAVTALQALRDKGHLRAGQSVLVNGAAGGVGTFAVQLAKVYGAEVTAVTRTATVELVRSLGADHVLDYTRDDFTRGKARYDIVIDMAGTQSLSAIKRALTPNGVLVQVGSTRMGNWFGPVLGPVTTSVTSLLSSQTLAPFLATVTRADLEVLSELLVAGTVTPVVDRTYPLSEVAAAIGYLESGQVTGKIVVTV